LPRNAKQKDNRPKLRANWLIKNIDKYPTAEEIAMDPTEREMVQGDLIVRQLDGAFPERAGGTYEDGCKIVALTKTVETAESEAAKLREALTTAQSYGDNAYAYTSSLRAQLVDRAHGLGHAQTTDLVDLPRPSQQLKGES
jgi:hypothetical protein